eukprot:TRINITY_DN316_c0_g1_i2.p1 TRINITY_DN316_c0_g1~~TRINITY_DN316_c0_g1_i2.p1  ORF type:complete len:201 (+),score=38.80 TRINITY_DN316_c0_g1_i2:128-730(+)
MSRMIIPKEAIQGKTITKKAYESLRDIFADYDMNASGTVDFQEFLLAFEGYPSRPEDTWRQRIAGSLFTRMDANNDGDITFRELLLAYFPRCSPEDVDRYMSMYEPKTEADLRLQRECARLAFCEDEFTLEQEHDLERVMGQFDTNKDGVVDLDELKGYCADLGIGDNTVEDWFCQYDADSSGSLDVREFKELFRGEWDT